jgi:hypothetical protein
MADALTKMLNLNKVLARLAKVPPTQAAAAGDQLKTEVDDLVEAQKRAAPVDPESDNPGNFRDSHRAYKNPDRPLSYRVINDAKDASGKPIASNIEQGHRTVDGKHVPGAHSFFATYRARKKGMRRRVLGASRKALKQIYPKD